MYSRRFRYRSHRRRNRGSGCLTNFLIVAGIIAGFSLLWLWFEQLSPEDNIVTDPYSLSDAQKAFAKGDLQTVIRNTRLIYGADSQRSDALLLLVRSLIFHSYSDYDREIDRRLALQVSKSAFERNPYELHILIAYALALQANGQPIEAYRMAERALLADPDHTLARTAMALSYASVGSFNNALDQINRALSNPTPEWQLDALRAKAIILSDTGRYAEAETTIQQVIDLNPYLPMFYFEKALYALQMGATDSATVAYFSILSQNPDNVKVRLRMCELSSLLREISTALEYCQQVIEMAPGWADGWYQLGREYFLSGEYASAQSALNRCSTLQTLQNIPIEDREFECWYLQGLSAEYLGDCESLVSIYDEFQLMAQSADLSETWTYPPEGPPACIGS